MTAFNKTIGNIKPKAKDFYLKSERKSQSIAFTMCFTNYC